MVTETHLSRGTCDKLSDGRRKTPLNPKGTQNQIDGGQVQKIKIVAACTLFSALESYVFLK
jgi:hypothetical protein